MQTRRVSVGAAIRACLFLVLVATARAPPIESLARAREDAGHRTVATVAEERIRIARQAIEIVNERVKQGTSDVLDRDLALWWRRLAETRREVGGKKSLVVDDLTAYPGFEKSRAERIEKLRNELVVGQIDVPDANDRVLEAESWLREATAVQGDEVPPRR